MTVFISQESKPVPETTTFALSCTNCGANLQITPDIDRFYCMHCGTQQIVRRGGGIVSLQPLVKSIERVQHGTDKTAAELAIPRLIKEIAEMGAAIETAKGRSHVHLVKPSTVEVTLPIVISVALMGVAICGMAFWWIPMIMFVFILCGLIIAYANVKSKRFNVNSKRLKEADRLRNLEVDRLQGAYNAKVAALAKNRQIANS